MNVTRDIITDLLPLYLAGEASPGTRALIEEYLRENPAFAEEVRAQEARDAPLLPAAAVPLPSDHEKSTLERVRRFNRRRTQLLALAIALTLIPFSFGFVEDRIDWIMLRDNPAQAIAMGTAALACWAAYYAMGRRLRQSSNIAGWRNE